MTLEYRALSAQLTKRAEKCVLIGYSDLGGVPSWGWGHTGPEVHVGQSITQQQADIDFARDQALADERLRSHVPPAEFNALTEHEKAALLDFTFNTGGGPELGDKGELNLWRVIRAGRLDQVPTELNRFIYVHVDGRPITSNGLKNRRAAEVVLWNTADVNAAVAVACAGGAQACSASARELPTPPASTAPKTLSKTSLAVKLGTAVTGLGGSLATAIPQFQEKAQAVHDLAAAHADNHYIAAVVSTTSAVVFALGVAALFIHHEQQKAAKV